MSDENQVARGDAESFGCLAMVIAVLASFAIGVAVGATVFGT